MELEIKKSYKQTEVGLIPKDWELKRLDELGSNGRPIIKAGPFGSSLKKEYYTTKGYKIYGQEQVIKNDPFFGDYFVSKAKFRELKSCEVIPGDILLSLVGTFGKILIIPENAQKGIINPRLLRISIDRLKFDVSYISYFLRSKKAKDILESKLQGGTMGVLNAGLLKPLPIPLPPTLAEQKAIATALSDVDALISSLDALIAKKKAIKQGAMQQLLTPPSKGGKRLDGFDGEWVEVRLGDIGETIIGLTYKPSDVVYSGTLILRSSNIQENKISFADKIYVSASIPEKLRLKIGDILVCVRNGSRRLIGKCIQIDERCESQSFGAFMSVFRSDHNDFVIHAFKSYSIHKQIEENLGATINQITNSTMNSFKLWMPKDFKEQKAIAQILSDMDKELEELATKKEKYEHMKQGMMQELLTGKTRLV